MEETTMLILLSFVMLIGSYVAGNIPLVVNLSEEKLQITSILGAGLLVGTALSVIIPEGVRSLFAQPHDAKVENDKDLHRVIGLTLVLGFIFMLLIDQISSRRRPVDAENLLVTGKQALTATIGLVVHSAADGVALGAAATTAHHDVEMIVFLAIMLHKAPAAFGLVSFLLHEGLERTRIRKHLLAFSLAAPAMALVTYFGLGQGGKETLSSVNATGTAMLFSAGTFLYVATVHVLPELTSKNSHSSNQLKFTEILALVVGALAPSFLTIGHHH